jgi:formylglycine-generating enzyme required for sulfatase activity
MTNSVGMKLVRIAPSRFTMGSPYTEVGRNPNEMLQTVNLSVPYYISTTEVTQGQYLKLMGTNPSDPKARGDDHPVQCVSWNDANEFCRVLSKLENRSYRLPTEAEWEFACRAGDTRRFAGTGDLKAMGWYSGNSHRLAHAVGLKKPNVWGLYDMHGNVAEWCADAYSSPLGKSEDLSGNIVARVIKGGSVTSSEVDCRSAARLAVNPDLRLSNLGFRVALDSH